MKVFKSANSDMSVNKYATNLVYLTHTNRDDEIESKIIYSILNKTTKTRRHLLVFTSDIMDEPNTIEYELTQVVPGIIYRIDFRLGFKIEPRINLFFKQVLDEWNSMVRLIDQ